MYHYPKHVGDYIADTVGLSMLEDGAYTRLMDQYYLTEKPLPLDDDERYRLARANTPIERKAVDYVVKKYFVMQEDGYHQKRADEEISFYQERADKARKNGQSGGRPRNPPKTDSVISGLQEVNPGQTQTKANREPLTNNREPTSARLETAPPNFPDPPPAGITIRPEVLVTIELRKLELKGANQEHPELIALLRDGVSPETIIETAKEAIEKEKGFPWVLATVRGRLQEAAKRSTTPKGQAHGNLRDDTIAELIGKNRKHQPESVGSR